MKYPLVTFFYPCPDDLKGGLEGDLKRADSIKVDRDLEFWNTPVDARRRVWSLQTYARLREAGYGKDIALSETLPSKGIVLLVPEPDIMRAFYHQWTASHRKLLVCTMRADVVAFRFPFADAEILQNGRGADGKRGFFIPHWSQPGLIPRRASRGRQIRTLTFKGDYGNLHPDFESKRFAQFLKAHELKLVYDGPRTRKERRACANWHDYSESDLMLAVRRSWKKGGLRPEKPASKLVNAWHAGVPALIGPEYAYRELRQSELDYIEVTTVEEAMDAIRRLQAKPRLYQAMIENGQRRAASFTPEQITARWAEVLFERLPQLLETKRHRVARHLPLTARQALNYVTMPPTSSEFKKQLGYVYRKGRQRWNGHRLAQR